jgi:fluoride exporter
VTGVYVALGAALGAPLRYLLGHWLDERLPWGTILVNLGGSFLLGLFSGLALGGESAALLGTGFCGALTTYSAFAVQTHDLGPRRGTLNVLLTLLPALLLCALGFLLASP